MSMYPDMDVFSDFGSMVDSEEFLVGFLAIYLLIVLLSLVYSIVVYVLQSLGLYSIAKRRGIHNPWLAWIPVGNMWIVGSISDQYQYVVKKNVRNRRKTLLGLMIALYALFVLIYVFAFAFGFSAAGAAITQELSAMIAPFVLLLICYLALLVIAVIAAVYQYIALYDLFLSSRPNSATVFLVLGIFFNFLLPYFVFACRKKDEGMPARQTPAQPAEPQYIPAPEVVEPEVVQEAEEPQELVAAEEDFEPEEE